MCHGLAPGEMMPERDYDPGKERLEKPDDTEMFSDDSSVFEGTASKM